MSTQTLVNPSTQPTVGTPLNHKEMRAGRSWGGGR